MTRQTRYAYKFTIWTETHGRVGGRGDTYGVNKNAAVRRAKSKLSKDLDVPPADINITELKKV